MIANKSDSHKWLQIKVIVTNDYKFSSNINEVIRSVLNFFFFFFLQKDFTSTKKRKTAYGKQKQKKMHIKHIQEKKSHLSAYLHFVLFLGCVFMLLVLLMLLAHAKSFREK